ncbi:MAG TPA: RidA family protein [Thermoanaerobaculia bacterium]|jgi:2-iminobutanoate/2-iminopropanoate deaminase
MKFLSSDKAPKAIGPYSQAVAAGGFLFASGQVNLDPATGALAGGDIGAAVHRCLDNITAVLAAGGLSLSDVVKTTVFLRRMEDFTAMNEVYAARFGDHRPARSTVAVADLPRNAPVEIEVIAKLRE